LYQVAVKEMPNLTGVSAMPGLDAALAFRDDRRAAGAVVGARFELIHHAGR
jgi:hypothetical protein